LPFGWRTVQPRLVLNAKETRNQSATLNYSLPSNHCSAGAAVIINNRSMLRWLPLNNVKRKQPVARQYHAQRCFQNNATPPFILTSHATPGFAMLRFETMSWRMPPLVQATKPTPTRPPAPEHGYYRPVHGSKWHRATNTQVSW
jgi:hypothetical protein